jgi:hypothetical protein
MEDSDSGMEESAIDESLIWITIKYQYTCIHNMLDKRYRVHSLSCGLGISTSKNIFTIHLTSDHSMW